MTSIGTGILFRDSATSLPFNGSAIPSVVNTHIPFVLPTVPPRPLAGAASSTTSEGNSPAAPSYVAIGKSIDLDGCPTENHTVYNDPNGQVYQIQCYVDYSGPTYIGLNETNFAECLQECSNINLGFSAISCYGATFSPYATGIGCNLKTQDGLTTYTESVQFISAVLITGVPPPVIGEW